MKQLRSSGIFKLKRIARRLTSFHENDLREFHELLLAAGVGADQCDDVGADDVRFADAMRMWTASTEGKAAVVAAFLDGRLPIVRKLGDEISDMVVRRDDVQALVRERASTMDRTRSAEETARRLRFDPTAITWLVDNGYLARRDNRMFLRILETPINAFSSEYVSCAEIARNNKTSSRCLVSRAKKLWPDLFEAQRSDGKSAQRFIRRLNLSALLTCDTDEMKDAVI